MKIIYIKTKFQLTDTISGLRTAKLNTPTHLFQMKKNGCGINRSTSTYQSKEHNKNALFSSTLKEFLIGSISCKKNFLK